VFIIIVLSLLQKAIYCGENMMMHANIKEHNKISKHLVQWETLVVMKMCQLMKYLSLG